MNNFPENSEKAIKIGGIDLYTYFFSYKPERPTAIALHGLRNDTLKMLPIVKELEPYYNVIAFDFPGYGKTPEYSDFDNYVEYGAQVLEEFIEKLELKTEEVVLMGGSYGANVIVNYLLNNPDKQFKKIGLLAPLYSLKALNMSPRFEKFTFWLTKKMWEGGRLHDLMQWFINSDKLFTLFMAVAAGGPYTKENIAHEKRLWRICTLKIWGKSVLDTINSDYSNTDQVIHTNDMTIIYPHSDQYLNVEKSKAGFAKIFPEAKFLHYDSKTHMPKGDFGKNKPFMDSIRQVITSEAKS